MTKTCSRVQVPLATHGERSAFASASTESGPGRIHVDQDAMTSVDRWARGLLKTNSTCSTPDPPWSLAVNGNVSKPPGTAVAVETGPLESTVAAVGSA